MLLVKQTVYESMKGNCRRIRDVKKKIKDIDMKLDNNMNRNKNNNKMNKKNVINKKKSINKQKVKFELD